MSIRSFTSLNSENQSNCNLTELNASESVDRGYVTHNDWLGHTSRFAYVWKNLTGHLRDTKSLLDVGCGKFSLPYFLWRNRCKMPDEFQYWGLDLRATHGWLPAEDTHWQVPLNLVKTDFLVDDLTVLPGWPIQFDTVVSFEVMEHLPRVKAQTFMDKLFSWTRPGGECFFSTPNAGVSTSTAENHLDPETRESREWDYDAKLAMAKTSGFEIVDTFGTFCGTTRLPEEIQERLKTDPVFSPMKKFLSHAMLTSVLAAPFPKLSNNALFHMRRSE